MAFLGLLLGLGPAIYSKIRAAKAQVHAPTHDCYVIVM